MPRTTQVIAPVLLTLVLACAGCGSGNTSRDAGPVPAHDSTAGPDSTRTPSSPAGGSSGSDFCAKARQIGVADAQRLASGTPRVEALLTGLRELDAVAPSEIKADFQLFTRAEYTLLDPGNPEGLPQAQLNQGSTPAALVHVQQYLSQTCGLSG